MAKGFIAKRVSTSGVVADVDNLTVLTTAVDLTAAKLHNDDNVTFTTNGTAASSISSQSPDKRLESSIWGADALQRTKNRLTFLGNALL